LRFRPLQEIAIAYQTLSDPDLRRKYNEFGPASSSPEGGFVDPEEVFGAMFGGARFEPLIGTISLAKDMKTAMQDDGDGGDGAPADGAGPAVENRFDAKGREIISPEEKARRDAKERKVAAEVSRRAGRAGAR
jgi:DnaJ-class molecular chaperone